MTARHSILKSLVLTMTFMSLSTMAAETPAPAAKKAAKKSSSKSSATTSAAAKTTSAPAKAATAVKTDASKAAEGLASSAAVGKTSAAAGKSSVVAAPANPAADPKLPSAVPFSSSDIWNVDIFKQEDHKVLVIQDRKYTKAKKAEVGLNFGITSSNAYFNAYSYGGHVAYHFNEYWGIETFYNKATYSNSREKNQLDDYFAKNGFLSTFEVQNPKHLYGVNAIWSPIYGKFAFFRSNIIHFDIFATMGISFMGLGTNLAGAADQNVMGSLLSAGTKVYLSKNTALRIEAKNNIYKTYYAPIVKQDGSGDIISEGKKVWWNAWHFMVGASYSFGNSKGE